jgi:hypothetical protein
MSNTKWRTVVSVLKATDPVIRQIIVKFINVADAKAMGVPGLHAPHAFVDSVELGPFPLVAIEWIEVPAIAVFPRHNHLPAKQVVQDIEAVRSSLVASGKKFPLHDTATGLRVLGHVR